jgi:hypothetical protein
MEAQEEVADLELDPVFGGRVRGGEIEKVAVKMEGLPEVFDEEYESGCG